ncbi:MAG TPA: hypothetical protein DDZ42_21600 [Candidatus Rokubacteria bacterium]|nr:hypothetical protein [Candidatus Rokubacteria bacterium]
MRRAGLALATLAALVLLGAGAVAGQALRLGQPAPELAGAPWINSAPLTTAGLRGRVVLVEFWTYG